METLLIAAASGDAALEEVIAQGVELTSGEAASAAIGGIVGLVAGMGAVALIIGLVILVLTIIAWWRIFTKAGEKGWKSIIPIYNVYILFKIAGRNFWKYLLICLGMSICSTIASSVGAGALATILGIVTLALCIWAIVELVLLNHGLSKNFGHGVGFTLGLIFLSTIFTLILGLGSSQYIGSKE